MWLLVNKPHLKIRCMHINFTYSTYKVFSLAIRPQYAVCQFRVETGIVHSERKYVKIHYAIVYSF